MPLGDFAEPGTKLKPLPIGRVSRLVFGVGMGFVFTWNVLNNNERAGSDFPLSGYWIGVVVAWWYFSDMLVVGLGRRWGRWPQVAVLPIALALVVVDLVLYGELWELPLAWGVFLFTEFFFALFAISFLLAAIFAVPG